MNTKYRVSYKKLVYCFINILLIVISYLIMISIEELFSLSEAVFLLSNVGTLFFVGYFLIYYQISKKLFTPYMVFFVSFFLFQFGQCTLHGLGIDYSNYYIFNYGNNWLVEAIKYTVLCIGNLNLGAILSHKEYPNKSKKMDLYLTKNVEGIAKLLFYLSAIVALPLAFIKLIISIKYGYMIMRIFEAEINFIITFIEYIFVPFGCLFLVYSNSKKVKRNIAILFFVWGAMMMISGDRTSGIAALLISCLNNEITANIRKKIQRQNIKKIIFIVLMVFLSITVVKSFRRIEKRDDMVEKGIVKTLITENIIVESVGEMGFSMMPLIMSMRVIPQYKDYLHGRTYLASILSLLPASIDPTGTIRKFSIEANLSGWLTDYYNLTFGTGYSLIAESYANYGFCGFWVFVFIGYIVGWLLDMPSRAIEKESLFWKYVRLAMIFELFTVPRRESYYIIKHSFYIIFCMAVLIMLFCRKKRKPKNNYIQINE